MAFFYPPCGNKISFNLLYYDDFTIPYTIDNIKNSPVSHKTPTQAENNVWIIANNG